MYARYCLRIAREDFGFGVTVWERMSGGDPDRPYWPQVNTATYKEVWIETANKWMWNMVRSCLPGRVTGVVPIGGDGEDVCFHEVTHVMGNALVNGQDDVTFPDKEYADAHLVFSCTPDAATGRFYIELPTGTYRVTWKERHCTIRITNGSKVSLLWPWVNPSVQLRENEDYTAYFLFTGDPVLESLLHLCAWNLSGLPETLVLQAGGTLSFPCEKKDAREPWLLVMEREEDDAVQEILFKK